MANIDDKLIEMMEVQGTHPIYSSYTQGFQLDYMHVIDGTAYAEDLETELGEVDIQNLEEQSEIFAEFNGCNGYEYYEGDVSLWHKPTDEDKIIKY